MYLGALEEQPELAVLEQAVRLAQAGMEAIAKGEECPHLAFVTCATQDLKWFFKRCSIDFDRLLEVFNRFSMVCLVFSSLFGLRTIVPGREATCTPACGVWHGPCAA